MQRASNEDFVPRGHFRRDLTLVSGLVSEHRRPGDIADGKDVRHIGAHLLVDGDDAALVDGDAGRGRVDRIAVGAAPHRHEDSIEVLRRGHIRTLECRPQAL